MGVLTILGLFPQTNTLGGYWPIFGADVLLHAVLAIAGAYFGYMLTSKAFKNNKETEDSEKNRNKAA